MAAAEESPAIIVRSDKVEKSMNDALEWVRSRPDAVTRAAAATWLAGQVLFMQQAIPELRAAAVRELAEDGFSMAEMAEMFGLSKSRIQQIIEGKPPKGQPKRGLITARCEWTNKTNGEQCIRSAAFKASDGRKCCGTHAGAAIEEGLSIGELSP